MPEIPYGGSELETFAQAVNWKRYLRDMMAPYVSGDVLEVGAGIGTTMRALRTGTERSWTCLEPDPAMAAQLVRETAADDTKTGVVTGTLDDLGGAAFDTILYVDVLEHIEDDRAEVQRAARRLRSGGRLLVMSPAHQFLFSPFDAQIGHFRRYSASALRALTPSGLELESVRYLDATGLLLSAANKLLLRSRMPTLAQVLTWDRRFVPVSRTIDPLLGHAVGKSVLAIWRAL